MTIGELAGHFGLATHVLRHWEAMGILAPAARINGRRRYGEEELIRVAIILRAKEAGASLEKVRELLTTQDGATRKVMLERHHQELQYRIDQAKAQQQLVEHVLACPSDDFLYCPNFRRLVRTLEARSPVSAWGC